MSTKRKPNESFEDYQKRRKEEQEETKTKKKGRLIVVGRAIVEKDGKKVNLRPPEFMGTVVKRKIPDKS